MLHPNYSHLCEKYGTFSSAPRQDRLPIQTIWSFKKRDRRVFDTKKYSIGEHMLVNWIDRTESYIQEEPEGETGAFGRGGLRLVVLLRRDTRNNLQDLPLSIEKGEFLEIMEHFGLPEAYLQSFFDKNPVFAEFQGEHFDESKSGTIGYIFRTALLHQGSFSLALNYDKNKGVVSGMAQGLLEHEASKLRSLISHLPHLSSHPMLIPVLLCELVIEVDTAKINSAGMELFKLEQIMGLHLVENYARSGGIPDFDMTTRSLNVICTSVSLTEKRLKSTLLGLRSIVKSFDNIRADPPTSLKQSIERDSKILEERVAYLTNLANNLLFKAEQLQKDGRTQISLVISLIGQRDNELNVLVAKDSAKVALRCKDDSSVMKIIATATLLFLPGAYISSFLSMGMFNWSAAPGQPVMSNMRGLWTYLAVTIPLTCVIIASVLLWFFRSHSRTTNEIRDLETGIDRMRESRTEKLTLPVTAKERRTQLARLSSRRRQDMELAPMELMTDRFPETYQKDAPLDIWM